MKAISQFLALLWASGRGWTRMGPCRCGLSTGVSGRAVPPARMPGRARAGRGPAEGLGLALSVRQVVAEAAEEVVQQLPGPGRVGGAVQSGLATFELDRVEPGAHLLEFQGGCLVVVRWSREPSPRPSWSAGGGSPSRSVESVSRRFRRGRACCCPGTRSAAGWSSGGRLVAWSRVYRFPGAPCSSCGASRRWTTSTRCYQRPTPEPVRRSSEQILAARVFLAPEDATGFEVLLCGRVGQPEWWPTGFVAARGTTQLRCPRSLGRPHGACWPSVHAVLAPSQPIGSPGRNGLHLAPQPGQGDRPVLGALPPLLPRVGPRPPSCWSRPRGLLQVFFGRMPNHPSHPSPFHSDPREGAGRLAPTGSVSDLPRP